ncbi:MAG: DUF2914 domain-containing protein [Methylovulum sp.]|uniref:DUF2914 domain-containing protein n=1 Tax=Methylovulum sp. TaxID=1916980 RepID=UPI00262E13F7|nr:DUF2914 domain-containing protein [Methylovulum sp.]MDD2723184.1 DUF2914 domain-containing protein [Methylovulum sp.]MDD5123125.1 DUF2914 domain-containing protein [Methylovulum sp.]
MAEKRNLVIKVKYPTATKAGDGSQPTAQVITVWNVRRIGLAAGLLLGLLVLLVYIFSGGDGKPVAVVAKARESGGISQTSVASPAKTQAVASPENHNAAPVDSRMSNEKEPLSINKQVGISQVAPSSKESPRVRRALLTMRVLNKEPANEAPQALRVKPDKPVTVYYFTELRGMNGKTLYHEWLRDGIQVAKEPLLVSADRWRVTTHRTLDGQAGGNWTVRLVDDHGNLLDEKYLELITEQE